MVGEVVIEHVHNILGETPEWFFAATDLNYQESAGMPEVVPFTEQRAIEAIDFVRLTWFVCTN